MVEREVSKTVFACDVKESNKQQQQQWEENESPGKWDENGTWAAALRTGG